MNRKRFIQTSLISTVLFPLRFSAMGKIPDEKFVINAGIGGNDTRDMLARIEQDCLGYYPDLTILMAGTNDCMNSVKYIPLSQYEQNMRLIISKILDTKSSIMLMSILPSYEPYLYTRHKKEFYAPEGYMERKRRVNELIKNLADEYHLFFLDMHHIFEATGNIGIEPDCLLQNEANSNKTDGVHPTNDGYRIMAVTIYEYIICRELSCKHIVCFGDSITAGNYPFYLRKLLNY